MPDYDIKKKDVFGEKNRNERILAKSARSCERIETGDVPLFPTYFSLIAAAFRIVRFIPAFIFFSRRPVMCIRYVWKLIYVLA